MAIATLARLAEPLRKAVVYAHRLTRILGLVLKILRLRFVRKRHLSRANDVPSLIVSVTSFPPRIRGVWAAIEAVFEQTLQPDRLILTLASEQFPGKKLPRRLRQQVRRGLEIWWLDENGGSFDKLLPLLEHFPDSCVVTIDDDKLIPPDLLQKLHLAHERHPGAIVGTRGWEMRLVDGKLSYGRGWTRAGAESTSAELFMTGNGGILYPPESMRHPQNQLRLAKKHAPSADDIWFWAISRASRTPMVCLGLEAHPINILQRKTPALADSNATENDPQFQSTINYFDLREQLTSELEEADLSAIRPSE